MESLRDKDQQLHLLNSSRLSIAQSADLERMRQYPVKVLQIGEGNFLRGFVDWMILACNRQGLFGGSVAVAQPRRSGKPKLEQLRRQEGLYTLLVRGVQGGRKVEENEVISVFSRMIDPYGDWEQFLALAENPDLEIVVSNTTEAGLRYQFSGWDPSIPTESYPAKLTVWLYRRFARFSGDPGKGLMLLPCELLEQNGITLRTIILQHVDDWSLPEAFKEWLLRHNHFLNSLVDRIVPGYPVEEAASLFTEWGYEDKLLTAAEPYYFWAIEGSQEFDRRFPLREAGLNVRWVEDLRPYQLRKVRILNGAHTIIASIGLLHGLQEVREVVEHPEFGTRVLSAVLDEIVPTLPFDTEEIRAYAFEVLERFGNPFIRHRLADIAMNSLSKFKVRLLPTLEAYTKQRGTPPPVIAEAFACLLRLYRVRKAGGRVIGSTLSGEAFLPRDDEKALHELCRLWEMVHRGEIQLAELIAAVLGNVGLWDRDLNQIEGLAAHMETLLTRMEMGEHE